MSPVPENNSRIQILDIIRGIAVLGILAVNIHYYALPEILASGFPVTDPDHGLGYDLGMLTEIFLSGKMRSLFAMLFGISSVLIIERLTQREGGTVATNLYFRRLLWLLGFGWLHGFVFLYYGDILFQYAVMGMIAFAFFRASSRLRTLVMVVCLGVLTWTPHNDYVYTAELYDEYSEIMASGAPEEELSGEEWEIVEEWEGMTNYIAPSEEDYADELEAKQGGYWEIFDYNRYEVLKMETIDLFKWYSWEILLYMLLGVSLFKRGFFRADYPRGKLVRITLFGLLIGGALQTWLHLAFYDEFTDPVGSLWYLIFFDLGRFPMLLGYAGLIVLLFRWKRLATPGRWLAAAGKMTLSNYLMQSLIAALLFYGFGLFNQLDRVELTLVVLGICIVQVAFSSFWMKRFVYGPAEWLWRTLTYWKLQPLKRVRS